MENAVARTEEALYRRLQRMADRVSFLIVASDYPAIDVAIEVANLRNFAERHFPDRLELFDLIYMSRFRRLWRQFRTAQQQPPW